MRTWEREDEPKVTPGTHRDIRGKYISSSRDKRGEGKGGEGKGREKIEERKV